MYYICCLGLQGDTCLRGLSNTVLLCCGSRVQRLKIKGEAWALFLGFHQWHWLSFCPLSMCPPLYPCLSAVFTFSYKGAIHLGLGLLSVSIAKGPTCAACKESTYLVISWKFKAQDQAGLICLASGNTGSTVSWVYHRGDNKGTETSDLQVSTGGEFEHLAPSWWFRKLQSLGSWGCWRTLELGPL